MATAAKDQSDPATRDSNENDRRSQVMVGDLPSTFLRVPTNEEIQDQMAKDSELAQRIAQEEMSSYRQTQAQQQSQAMYANRLIISIVEAKLNKNYGMTRMDPFCSIRVNHTVYETETCQNGAKNPTWTRPIPVLLNEPVDSVYIEIYDEGTISGNTKIAWTKIKLPESVKNGQVLDDWWPLSGGLGDEKEGTVHVIFSQKKQVVHNNVFQIPGTQHSVQVPGAMAPGVAVAPTPHQQVDPAPPPAPIYTDEDIKQIKDLFPSTDEEVIKTVMEASRGNKNAAIDMLLNMQ